MRAFVIATVVASGLILQGCAGAYAPLPEGYSFGDVPGNAEERIQSHFSQVLKDPSSAQYKIGNPFKAHCNLGILYGGKVSWAGWAYPVSVNAKNSYGGYVGFQDYVALLDGNDKVADYQASEWSQDLQLGLCKIDL